MPHLSINVTTASSIKTTLALPLSILTETHILTIADNSGAVVFNGKIVVNRGDDVITSSSYCAPLVKVEDKSVTLCGSGGIDLPMIVRSDDFEKRHFGGGNSDLTREKSVLLWNLPIGAEGEWIFILKGEINCFSDECLNNSQAGLDDNILSR